MPNCCLACAHSPELADNVVGFMSSDNGWRQLRVGLGHTRESICTLADVNVSKPLALTVKDVAFVKLLD